jgi:16S rRNA C1402 N4-methylase RsmH
MTAAHVPVMQREAMQFLSPERGGTFVDCTVGLGGHSGRSRAGATPESASIAIRTRSGAHSSFRRGPRWIVHSDYR